jgi:catechol 2,3-dioxygenase-like lactoylglutathione lyase family enzyme
VEGLSHLTFVVSDLERMAVLLCQGLGAREIYDSGDYAHSISREKFFMLGDIWIATMEGAPSSDRSYRHVAFKVSEADLPVYKERLATLGVELVPDRHRGRGEGHSLYFRDLDNHLFELHTGTLDERLRAYQAAESTQISAISQ